MDLDPRSVELPLDDRTPEPLQSAADILGRLREHRRDRSQDLEPELAQTGLSVLQGSDRDPWDVAGKHRRPPHARRRNAGGLRHRVDHHSLQRALAKLAEEEPDEQPLLGLGRLREQLLELEPPRRFRAGSGNRLNARDRRIDLEELERRRAGRRSRQIP